MKKVTFTAIFAFVSIISFAQPRAVGLRVGFPRVDVSYQHSLSEKVFLQVDAGLGYPVLEGDKSSMSGGANFTYNWLFPIKSWTKAGAWNWYAGFGLAASGYVGSLYEGFVDTESEEFKNPGYYGSLEQYESRGWRYFISGVAVGFAGALGVEYNFKFPLQLALDYHPNISYRFSKMNNRIYTPRFDYENGLWLDNAFALSVRYRF